MPKGPRGEKRPADLIGMSVMVGKIATGEIEDNRKSGQVRQGRSTGARRKSQRDCAQGGKREVG